MSFKDKVSVDFGKAEDNMVIEDEDYIIQHGEFLLEEYMKYVLTRGPWHVVGQYVTTKRWKPGFDPEEEKITHMTVWGGKFACICVELDISKPLTPFIEVEGRTYGVVYEGIQMICFECGHYDHGRDNCPLEENAKIQASEAAEAETMKNVTGLDKSAVEIENLEATRTDQMPGAAVNAGINAIEENPPNLHGQWMLLKRKKKKKKKFSAEVGKVHVEQKKQSSTGSRFTVLEADGNRGVASKETTNTNQNSLTGVKKATHNSAPKRSSWVHATSLRLNYGSIISCCKMKIHDHWCCTIKHIYREKNAVADALATRSCNLDFDLHVYEEAPDFLRDILVADARSVVRPCYVAL
ncbi:hypothetical protein DKX38_001788 [Salix brachista]|uniref:Uncharacterized protein n=1 Tax=Salix brachista TaxID=2182728 RepID=A0A5N5NK74_9ROSI|nr:hypothetical protein DKX38_001788 [Salix brachista]